MVVVVVVVVEVGTASLGGCADVKPTINNESLNHRTTGKSRIRGSSSPRCALRASSYCVLIGVAPSRAPSGVIAAPPPRPAKRYQQRLL